MTLKNLCKYYISCIALESNTTLRASLKDEQALLMDMLRLMICAKK